MFIEKHGQSLKNAKEASAQNTVNSNNISTITARTNSASGFVNDLVYLNNSFNTVNTGVTQLQADYNNLVDRLTYSVTTKFELSIDFKIPATGIHELTDFTKTFNKSYGTNLIFTLGLSYINTNFSGSAFEIYYDIGNGWVLWSNFFYNIEDAAQFQQYYLLPSSIPSGNKTIKIGLKDLSGQSNSGKILSLNLSIYEVA